MSAAIDAGPAWSAWTSVTPVLAAPASRERYVRVPIPFRIAPDAAGNFPDLRVIDANGNEVAYAIDPQQRAPAPRRLDLIDAGFVPGRWTQAVVDLGIAGGLVDTILLDVDTTQRPTYFTQLSIDASDDRATWRTVRDDVVIYRVAQDNGRGNQTITFPATRSRWLRVRVQDPRKAFPLQGAELTRTAARSGTVVAPLPTRAQASYDAQDHRSVFTFDSGFAIRPSGVAFTDSGSSYVRHVVVESSDDGKQWTTAGYGEIAVLPQGGREHAFSFAEATARHWRVTIENGNDQPVPGLRPTLLARLHDVVFAATPSSSYRLLSGNPNANAPAYDLGERLAREGWHADPSRAGTIVANAGFRDERPVTERFPWLLSAALVVVAGVLGLLALRTVRAANAS